jgi:hypothetical protein
MVTHISHRERQRSEPNHSRQRRIRLDGKSRQRRVRPGRPIRNFHLGNHTKFLPFHAHDFATLEIDTNSLTVQDRKSHRDGGFFHVYLQWVDEFSDKSFGKTNLAIGSHSTRRDKRTYKPVSGDGRGEGVRSRYLVVLRHESHAALAQAAQSAAAPQSRSPAPLIRARRAAPQRSCTDTETDPPTMSGTENA